MTPSFGGMATCRGGRRAGRAAATTRLTVYDRKNRKTVELGDVHENCEARDKEFTERKGALSLAAGTDTQEVSVDKTLKVVRNRPRAVLTNDKNDDRQGGQPKPGESVVRKLIVNESPKENESPKRKGG